MPIKRKRFTFRVRYAHSGSYGFRFSSTLAQAFTGGALDEAEQSCRFLDGLLASDFQTRHPWRHPGGCRPLFVRTGTPAADAPPDYGPW